MGDHPEPTEATGPNKEEDTKMRKTIGLSATLTLALAALAAAPVSAHTLIVDEDVDGNVRHKGDTVIEKGVTVSGNVTVKNGDLDVKGTVEGKITQKGDGDVVIDSDPGDGTNKVCVAPYAVVEGDISEKGDGIVHVLDCSTVEGRIKESGDGDVVVARESVLKGDLSERGSGKVRLANEGTVEGDVSERNDGDVEVLAGSGGSLVKGDLRERDDGCINIHADSTVQGTVTGNLC